MQTLDIHRPEMPDLQFVLLVTALCTSRLAILNIPSALRSTVFDRCWVLIHESPPPRRTEARVLDLRPWNELTVEAMAESIRAGLSEAGIHTLAWDHRPSEPTRTSTFEVPVIIDRLAELYPPPPAGAADALHRELAEDTGMAQGEEGTGDATTPR
jgi:hypothetical protein